MSDTDLPFYDDEPETDDALDEGQEPAPEDAKAGEEPEAAEKPGEVDGKGDDEAAPPAASEEKQSGNVPLSALLDEREKRQQAQREAEELRAWRQQQEAAKKQPDFYDDPQAALQHQQQQFQQMLAKDRVERSHVMAVKEHGEDFVKEVVEFYNDPRFSPKSHEFLKHPFPMQAAIDFYNEQKLLTEVGGDPDGWRKKQAETLRAEIRAELEAEIAQKQPAKPAAPPRSLASAPSAGGETPSPGSAFDEIFPG